MGQRIQRIEDVTTVEVGRFYLVNTVQRIDGATLPIHGPLHEDAEIINFPHLHWHIDWRFVDKRTYQDYFAAGCGRRMPWAR